MRQQQSHDSYWKMVWKQFRHHSLGTFALMIVLLFCLMGIYAPFLASSKPLVVNFDGDWYFPLFRYLFYRGFFTKRLDLFYNLLIFTLPLFILAWITLRNHPYWRRVSIGLFLILQFGIFTYLAFRVPQDPEANPVLSHKRENSILQSIHEEKLNPLLANPLLPNWETELTYLTPYAKLNLVLRYQQMKAQAKRLQPYEKVYAKEMKKNDTDEMAMPILWYIHQKNDREEIKRYQNILKDNEKSYPQAKQLLTLLNNSCHNTFDSTEAHLPPWIICNFLAKLSNQDLQAFNQAHLTVEEYERAQANLKYDLDRQKWLENQSKELSYEVMPLLRPFHWEDDAGGSQNLNRIISWWELTRINRKDMVAALIFGVRISLTVGLCAVGLALLIGIPIGAISGYYGGTIDIIIYRLIEIWESMPTFFMLLMVVAFLQNKSIFIIVAVIGLFGWTGFSRFVRGEFFRQKQLPYVEACHALGFNNRYIMFSHLLPNSIPPILTLVPFAIMGAITSEAGLSFLGLGEEGSCSWGVLMDEGRTAFPAESYLLWPPAILLTIFLVAIALVGDALRDALDPKLRRAN